MAQPANLDTDDHAADAAAPEAEAETCDQATCDAPAQTDAAGNPVVEEGEAE